MSNNWSQQPPEDRTAGNNGIARSGLLSDYRQQQPNQQVKQFSPINMPVRQVSPSNQIEPRTDGLQQRPAGGLLSRQRSGIHLASNLVSNTFDMVRRFSGKMGAVAGQQYDAPAPPLTRYHAPPPPPVGAVSDSLPKVRPWKRSFAVRMARRMRHRRERWQRGGNVWVTGSVLTVLAVFVVLFSSGTAYGYGYYQSQLPRLQNIANLHISQTTRIYDRNGKLLKELRDPNEGYRTPITFDDVPRVMVDAMISTEDKSFWENVGVDPQGLLRALSKGGSEGGGSGITQQLIKKMIFTHGENGVFDRKLPEATLAVGLTQQYPKTKILEMYFNTVPFGSENLGIEAAVNAYFGLQRRCDKNFKCTPGIKLLEYNAKGKKDPILGLARASLLAGMPQQPSVYDPTLGPENKQAALERQKLVLQQMVDNHIYLDGLQTVITPAIAKQAEELTAKMDFKPRDNNVKAPHFVDWIVGELKSVLGNGDMDKGAEILVTGGFNIYTTLDLDLQQFVERVSKHNITEPTYQYFKGVYSTLNKDLNVNDTAAVVMDAKTGEVLAMNGSIDYFKKGNDNPQVGGNVNIATSYRQPGSTFKPFVYATTFQMGWTPGIVLPDFRTFFPNGLPAGTSAEDKGLYTPTDYGRSYNNQTFSIRKSTANSFNVPAVKAISFAGVETVVNTVRRMGITSIDDYYLPSQRQQNLCIGASAAKCAGPSLALGSVEVTLLQMVGAYQVFANKGVKVPPQGIRDIWDNYGHQLYHWDPAKIQKDRIFSEQVSYMMTSVLADQSARSFEFGSNTTLSLWDYDPTCQTPRHPLPDCLNYQVAAKTGTTEGFRDNWTLGYTPNVVVGVWAGNAKGESMADGVTGITGAGPIWNAVVARATGLCSEAKVGVSCGAHVDRYKFAQNTFEQPPGIHKQCFSDSTGLKGGGSNCDWVMDGQDPLQDGPVSANPPLLPPKSDDKNNG